MKKENGQKEESKWKKFLLKNAFPLFGLGALVWFLIRVIPKPSRAGYPCMKVAAPMASSFVLWIIGLVGAVVAFKKMKIDFCKSSYFQAGLFLFIGILFLIVGTSSYDLKSFASTDKFNETVKPLAPIGDAKGINPGRVVWVWNPDATNENCTNKYYGEKGTAADTSDDGWFLNKNNDQIEIDKMLSSSLKKLTDENTDIDAWENIFKYFNQRKLGKLQGYTQGEKIFIKVNATSTWGKGKSWGNITSDNDHSRNDFYGMSETSPHLILSLLSQLIDTYGVQQENIFVGDPMKFLYNNSFDLWESQFPNVHYISNDGGSGREQALPTANNVVFYSDKGNEMSDAVSDKIYTVMNDADYLINVPTLKAHARAGVTLFAKNHFGSHTRNSAEHLHPGLVAIPEGIPSRTDSSLYRVQVDMMGHEKIGNNQVLFLLDALWAGSEAVEPPTKWEMTPFNNDWTSSIFVSQDMVAIESVAFDFLYTEYDGSVDDNYLIKVRHPRMTGTTDYLRQAASSEYWPDGVSYDPEGDGTPIGSLGVNEHWNNSDDKQYSRNLGIGDGIELVFVDQTITTDIEVIDNVSSQFTLKQNYPNPFNPTTSIKYSIPIVETLHATSLQEQLVQLNIYDVLGKHVATIVNQKQNPGIYEATFDGGNLASGTYIYKLQVGSFVESKKMILLK
ncbi:MAG: DUF362 domain-containing protein [Melioribacteraceae bacterium]